MSVGVVNKQTGDRIPTAGDPLDKVGNLANLTTTAKDNAVNAINEVNAGLATKADLTDLAPAFSTSTAYTVGQYVSYDGNIYKCTSAHSAGAWVAGDFTLVAVGSELSEINSNISTLESGLTSVGKLDEPLSFAQTDKASTISFTGTVSARSYLARLVIVGQTGVTECINVMAGGATAGTPADLSQTYLRVSDNAYGVASSGNSDGKITLAAGINGGWGSIYVIPVHGNIGSNNVSIEYAS